MDRFDGSVPLESFLINVETCADYNQWDERKKLAQLKASLRGPAAQILLEEEGHHTFEGLVASLRNHFGTRGHETQYENQLKTRRRKKDE